MRRALFLTALAILSFSSCPSVAGPQREDARAIDAIVRTAVSSIREDQPADVGQLPKEADASQHNEAAPIASPLRLYLLEPDRAELAKERLALDKATLNALTKQQEASAKAHGTRQDAFDLQRNLTIIIALTCHLIIFAGLTLAVIQFWRGIKAPESTVQVGPLKVSTTFLGLAILMVSLGFYSLFITEVYQIRDEAPGATASTKSNDDE